jgi:hypothetical protein
VFKPVYQLTIGAGVGGATNPTSGVHTYVDGTSVQVTAIPSGTYEFDHWELDGSSVGSANPYTVAVTANHTLNAVFDPPLQVSISPMQTVIFTGQSVSFNSTITGGKGPYGFVWYVNDKTVSGATMSSWKFTPGAVGTYYVYVKVTDANAVVAQSGTAKVTVLTGAPVGGYSVPALGRPFETQTAVYALAMSFFAATLSLSKRAGKKKRPEPARVT